MPTVDLSVFSGNEFVLHFGGRPSECDAYTFANSLLAFSDALREINRQVNPDFRIEIAIEATGPGSFRARLKTTATSLSALLKHAARDIVIAVLATMIYEKAFAPKMDIIVQDDEVVIQRGADRIIIPRAAYEARQRLRDPQEVDRHISRGFSVLNEDPAITDFGFTPLITDESPVAIVPRDEFGPLSRPGVPGEALPDTRSLEQEGVKLVVLRAVLERGGRKWQFVWNGIRISAAITDPTFYDRLARREFEFGQGDVLVATLLVHQSRDDVSGAYMNEWYEVTRVTSRIPGPRQDDLSLR